jgi:hypothetical protein
VLEEGEGGGECGVGGGEGEVVLEEGEEGLGADGVEEDVDVVDVGWELF